MNRYLTLTQFREETKEHLMKKIDTVNAFLRLIGKLDIMDIDQQTIQDLILLSEFIKRETEPKDGEENIQINWYEKDLIELKRMLDLRNGLLEKSNSDAVKSLIKQIVGVNK